MSALFWHSAVGHKIWSTKTDQDGGSLYPIGWERARKTKWETQTANKNL